MRKCTMGEYPNVEDCDCVDWKEGADSINNMILMGSIRSANIGYTGKAFRFCPWCGKKLVEKEEGKSE